MLRPLLRHYFPLLERDFKSRASINPFFNDPPDYVVEGSPCRLGIIHEYFQYHKHYIAACREMGISYRLIDITGNDWVERVRKSGCDAFLVWPSSGRHAWRDLFDDRLRIMEADLGLLVYPTLKETWLYEDKCRERDWMLAKGISHPQTWIFYSLKDAESFAQNAILPVVVKTRLGAANCGVWIVKSRPQLKQLIRNAFSRGLLARNRYRSEYESGFIFIQEFLPDVREWRMVRMGDSYFGHMKGKLGEFHSGSGKVDWTPPEAKHLDLLKHVTDIGGFTSMDVDLFETPDGKLYVNELQTVFGASVSIDQSRVDGKPGRFIQDPTTGAWIFEEGDFARNACCNVRVQEVLKRVMG